MKKRGIRKALRRIEKHLSHVTMVVNVPMEDVGPYDENSDYPVSFPNAAELQAADERLNKQLLNCEKDRDAAIMEVERLRKENESLRALSALPSVWDESFPPKEHIPQNELEEKLIQARKQAGALQKENESLRLQLRHEI